jgi:hypothetical protein
MTEKSWKTREVFGMNRDVPLNYVQRKGIDDKLIDYLTREQHIVIYGSSKQGKTCLRKYNLADKDYVVVSCQNNSDLRQLHTIILKSAGYIVQESTNKTVDGKSKVHAKFGIELNLPGIARASAETGASAEDGAATTTNYKALEIDPADANEVINALTGISFSKFIVLEDFHYLPIETQQDFAISLKAFHENSRITFIIVAVWREENRLILFNGDLTGRVIAIDADAWTHEQLREVISGGEPKLNVVIPEEFKNELVSNSFESVYIVQESCNRACVESGLHETSSSLRELIIKRPAIDYIEEIVKEQSGRYKTFLQIFASGFLTTELNMYKWVLYPIIISEVRELEKGLSYRKIRETVESKHPEGKRLRPGNLTQALQQISNLQTKKNLKPFILDYDSANLLLSIVDKGFLIWLQSQDRVELLRLIDLEVGSYDF